MSTNTLRRTFLAGLLIAALLPLLGGTLSQAGKRPGGGGTGDTGGGTIYFDRAPGGFSSMDSSGGSKTSLGIYPAGDPSYALHAGQRWFLHTRELPGEFYPNGATRRELFAVRVDAQAASGEQAVQLTDQPSLEVYWNGHRWTPGDENVSWTARRWETTIDPLTGQVVFTGNVIEGGIYGAGITFGNDGDSPELLAQPANPLVPIELIVTQGSWEAYVDGPTLAPNVNTHSWSPLAAFVVYSVHENGGAAWIADPVSGDSFQLVARGWRPVWSPDGSKIAYDGYDGIETINPDGTNRKAIISSTATVSSSGAVWSPTGSHLAYTVYSHKPSDPSPGLLFVYRATATGGGRTKLTPETTYAYPVGWR
jgi:hypothetical protein